MNLYTEATLSDSVIYQMMNNNKALLLKINSCLKNGTTLDESYVQEQLYQINRTHLSPLSDKVVEAFRSGRIILIYVKTAKIPKALPFVVAKIGGQNTAFVFVDNYGTVTNKSKVEGGNLLSISMKDLYALMEGAYMALQIQDRPMNIKRNLGLMKICANIYTQEFLKILNREYSISMDVDVFNRVSFTIAKFFMKNIWECENRDVIFSYATSTILNPNKMDLSIVNDSFDKANIVDINELIVFIKSLSPRLSTLNIRYFVECYINMYHAPAIFGIDYLPYFLFTITSTLTGSFIVNQPVISDITKNTKGMNVFYPELAKVF